MTEEAKEVGSRVSIRAVIDARKLLVEKYERKTNGMSALVKKCVLHAYMQATDDMLKAMDEAKLSD